ncbi:MAG: chemotaxis protein CheD [Deltaproteobacteria bacterium]|nr:chemotaxis protein CheD [Deltaproteobacteria bacterium]
MDEAPVKDFFLKPGHVFLPVEPTLISTVVSSGIAVTLYDFRKGMGGMASYLEPVRPQHVLSTPVYACPAIIGLIQMFRKIGSRMEHLEAQLFGGSENELMSGFVAGLGEKNIEAALEILDREGIRVAGQDVGGYRGRKVVFQSATGEALAARVNAIRKKDWYPSRQAI